MDPRNLTASEYYEYLFKLSAGNNDPTSQLIRPSETKVMSEELIVTTNDLCQGCGAVQLNTQQRVYNYQSRKFDGVWILGCWSCWRDDVGANWKEYEKEGQQSEGGRTTIYKLVKKS